MAKKGKKGKKAAAGALATTKRSGSNQQDWKKSSSTREYEELMGESQVTALGNPYFDDKRNPRYTRIYAAVSAQEVARLGLGPRGSGKKCQTVKQWQQKARAVLSTRGETEEKNKDPINLWTLIVEADEVRQIPAGDCTADGYCPQTGFHVINGVRVLTVGRALPRAGDVGDHFTAIVVEYKDAAHASTLDLSDGSAGATATITINDSAAVVSRRSILPAIDRLSPSRGRLCLSGLSCATAAAAAHLSAHTDLSRASQVRAKSAVDAGATGLCARGAPHALL